MDATPVLRPQVCPASEALLRVGMNDHSIHGLGAEPTQSYTKSILQQNQTKTRVPSEEVYKRSPTIMYTHTSTKCFNDDTLPHFAEAPTYTTYMTRTPAPTLPRQWTSRDPPVDLNALAPGVTPNHSTTRFCARLSTTLSMISFCYSFLCG